nr:alpha/beta hydrolase [Qingshengfaniella alkalisoli]
MPDILKFSDPTPARYFTTHDGLRLAYRDSGGDGPALLCLPGLTRNMDDFRSVASRFADEARIVRLDPRGRGISDHAPDYHSYSIEDETRDALELLDHLRIPEVAILGTSRGGLIALHIAKLAPDRLTGVCFNDIGPEIETKGLAEIAAYIGRDPGLKNHEEAAAALPTMMAPAFKNVSEEDWRAFSHSLWQQGPDGLTIRYDRRLSDAFADQARAIPQASTAWDAFDALAGKPVAVLRGENSIILSEDTLAEMRRRRPDLHVAEIPDRGHVPFLNEPQSQELLRDFIERLT